MARKKTPTDYLAMSVCGNCKHWRRLTDINQIPTEDVLGECLRYPPTVFGVNEDDATIQAMPVVEARHYCGEHGRVVN
jgi:hypothetical protein